MMKSLVKMSVCALTLLIASCGGGRRPHYYALEIPPAPDRTLIDPRFPGILAVSRLEAPSYLRQGRIVYRETPEEVGFYDYHRWAAEPAETVTTAMIEALRSSRLFSSVKRYDGHSQQDYLLVGRIERLEEIDYGGPVRVEAQISAELLNLRTGAIEWTGKAPQVLNVDNRNVDSVVRAMNGAVQNGIDQLMASLNQRFSVSGSR
ncbi:MAG TPA: ABC-type transport auxiliary lipoprotein family protein [Candidatus Binatia bacterium]|nr:ABC-type transport auxiliary lipoprotein family protein [Candidatus Eisenbacteria bacterium]HXJ88971.1 ABC-type transport auxiliary lipoprotein family protein [Candidatus Binatia bacterium]